MTGKIEGDFAPVLHSDSNQVNIAPLIWYGRLIMSSFIDCGMHFVFHSIVAYTVVKVEALIKDHGMSQQFECLSNHYLQDIQTLRLDWCNINYYQKRSGWPKTN